MTQLHTLIEGKGPRLLLLHGIGGSATAWTRLIQGLADDFTCIAPDLPGYGESAAPAASGLEPMLDAVATLLDETPAFVIGVSFGALLALALARTRPRLVKGLVLADATLGRSDLNTAEKAQWLKNRTALAHSLQTVAEERAAEIASPSAPADTVKEIAMHMRRARPEGYMNVAEIIAATDARPWLHDITCPTMVIYGKDDGVTGLAMSEALANGLPHAHVQAIDHCGHAPHIEQPDVMLTCVKNFVARCTASTQVD